MAREQGWREFENGVRLHDNGQGQVRLFAPFSSFESLSNVGSDSPAAAIGNGRLEEPPVTGTDPKSKLEFVEYKFRMLSKSYIPGYGLDFSEGDVLQEALAKFAVKLFRNHYTTIEQSLGLAHSPVWTNSRGVEGVDAVYRIFRKFGEDVIDRLDAGVVDSTSVGIHFLWRKSHPELEGYSFYDNIGKEMNGHVVRFVVTKILRVVEASIVYAGADADAKRLDANVNLEPQDRNDEKLQYSGDTMEIEKLKAQLSETETKVTALEAEKSELNSKLSEAQKKIEELMPKAALAEAIEKDLRETAVKNYRLSAGDKAKEEMVKTLQEADLSMVKTLSAEYAERAEELHPLTCGKCGAKGSLTRASSAEAPLEQPKTSSDTKKRASDYKMPGKE